MKTKRREFIKASVLLGASTPLLSRCLSEKKSEETMTTIPDTPIAPLQILILGGTSFLGPHQIKYALHRGHQISTFTRGKSVPTVHADLLDQVESLIGDRENDLEALKNRQWDVVIDNSGRQVSWTEATARLLKNSAAVYLYISSISVFYPYYTMNVKEDGPIVLTMPDNVSDDEAYLYEYGVMKANSELAARRIFGEDRTIVVRPTFMTGPGDKTDRFMYWPIRLAEGGDVIVPGKKSDQIQYIDVRDMAEWTIRLLEEKAVGTYNGAGPKDVMNMQQFVAKAAMAFDQQHRFVNIDEYSFLQKHNLNFMAPYVLPSEKFKGITNANHEKALAAGLSYRDLARTVKDTYEWWISDAVDAERRKQYLADETGILARESEILKQWEQMVKG